MNVSLLFIRIFFSILSVIFFCSYSVTVSGLSFASITIGAVIGLIFSLALIALEALFKTFNLRSFNLAILGLFCGYLMAQMIMLIFDTVLSATLLTVSPEITTLIKTTVYLLCGYLGTILAVNASEEFYFSIPFVKLKASAQKKRDLIIDSSALSDARIVDLAATGLLDNHLIIPRFLVKELNHLLESGDENTKLRCRRSLEALKKLENIPNLNLRYTDTDPSDIKEPFAKILQLARILNASVITADLNRIQQSMTEGVRFINIHSLSNALKPITQNGELLNIKIQRYGKEPRQGVGYLDDGTMVVVNGGAEFIGESIKAQVLSVKHTTSGRMIFCNTADEFLMSDVLDTYQDSMDSNNNPSKSYY